MMRFTVGELGTIVDALAVAASRREAQANFVKHGRHHDIAASEIRRLRARFMGQRLAQRHPDLEQAETV